MRIFQQKKLYLPAFSIVAVVLFLLGLISISTYRNLNREKHKTMTFLHRQGITLLSAIEAGAKTGMMMHMWQEDTVDRLLQEIAKNEDVAYIYMFNSQGRIVHHSDTTQEGKMTTWAWKNLEEGWVYSRRTRMPDDSRVYEVAKFFTPIGSPPPMQHMMQWRNKDLDYQHTGDIIVLGLKMTAYDAARQSDLRHALVMAAIVLMLGTAVFFFIFVIQNYYLVDRTLRQTQDYTHQIIASMASGLVSIDLDGRIISFNEFAEDLLGFEPKGIKGIDLKSILDFQAAGIQEVMDHNLTITDKEIRYLKERNEIIPLSISVSPIRDQDGDCNGAVLILRDLRRIKQLEDRVRRSEKLAAVGQLAAGLAHEIRNPLSSIRGFTQFLRHALKENPKEQEYAEIMIKEIDRINRVVTDLLSFANPKAAEVKRTDANELVDHVIRLIEADARAKNTTIHQDISTDLKEIRLDPYQMTQALLNLFLNALKFIESGGRIDVKASLEDDGTQFVFQVEDDGPGIPKENLPKIFDPFFTTRETGTGLGLAIVYKIVENHLGEIDVESPPSDKSRGCRFVIRIPMNDSITEDAVDKDKEKP
jgi:two-component system sensor histidine kinase HydH